MLSDESMAEAWVFVRVIDNYGDAGVGWRLSCLLAEYLHMHVRLWIDDTDALNKLVPAPEQQTQITIEAWQGDAMMQQQLSAAA
ncbi:Uncharacterized protein conserved in bacteria (DUF2331), partial [Snodgrassella alvi SCGC AB-598-P14]